LERPEESGGGKYKKLSKEIPIICSHEEKNSESVP
jgi:hypothetical protein